MTSTPLHHAIRLMPTTEWAQLCNELPQPTIRTPEDITALGERFFGTWVGVTSLQLLRDPTLTQAARTHLATSALIRGNTFGDPNERRVHRVWRELHPLGADASFRYNDCIALVAEAIRDGRVDPTPPLRRAVNSVLHAPCLRGIESDGVRAALAMATAAPAWEPTERHAWLVRSWSERLMRYRGEQAAARQSAEMLWGEHARREHIATRDIPLLSLETPFDASPATATPVATDTELDWVMPPDRRTLTSWRDRGGRRFLTPGWRMMARDPDALEEIAEMIGMKRVVVRAFLGGAPLVPDSPHWERMAVGMDEATRAGTALDAHNDFTAALELEPGAMPATVYRSALRASQRFRSLRMPERALFTFPLTEGTCPLWGELAMYVIERASEHNRPAMILTAQIACHVQRTAQPEIARALTTAPGVGVWGARPPGLDPGTLRRGRR